MEFAAKFGMDLLISTHNIRVTAAAREKSPSNAVRKGGKRVGGGLLAAVLHVTP